MATLGKNIGKADAEEFCKNNGEVMRTIIAVFRRGWFRIKDLCETMYSCNMGVEDVMQAIDYFEDRGYIAVRDIETHEAVLSCDADSDEIELRLTADGKLLGYRLNEDKGIDL